MPEIANVAATQVIDPAWGNDIRDRTVQRYASASARNSSDPTPDEGQVSYLEDKNELQVYTGAAWSALVPTGVVLPYAGPTAPDGFLLCDGAEVSRTTYAALFGLVSTTFGVGNGTSTFNVPDLRQRFILGLAASGIGDEMGELGGSIDHTHTNPTTASGGSHTHDLGNSESDGGGTTGSAGAHTHPSLDFNTSSEGSHSHSFSDSFTTGGPSSTLPENASGVSVAAGGGHTHSGSVSGTTGAGGNHTHSVSNLAIPSAGAHTHSTPAHVHDLGISASGGSHTHTQGNTGGNNPPFLALNHIIKT